MTHRFHAADAATTGASVTLEDDESSHLRRVLRLAVGDRVDVFNGRGSEWSATVTEVSRSRVLLTLDAPRRPLAEPGVAITLTVAVLKGDKTDAVIRDAVMLGAGVIRPLVSERTEVSLASIERGRRRERWQRIVLSSAKQCGRAVLPEVVPVVTLDAALADPARGMRMFLVEPGASELPAHRLHDVTPATAVDMFIGPVGGWTAGEVAQAAAAGSMLVTLGHHILRADAAPLVALSALRAIWKDF